MAVTTTAADLNTLLDSLATTYDVAFYPSGTWEVYNVEGRMVYRGLQREVLHWLNQQPTA